MKWDRPLSRFIGPNEVWRSDGTGTRTWFLFWVPVHSREFYHSTTYFGGSNHG